MNRALPIFALTALIVAAGCRDELPTVPARPDFDISDATHAGGNRHFYFLPPLVAAPDFAGVFDASQTPEVRICVWTGSCGQEIAHFSMTPGSGSETVRLSDQHYVVNWHTGEFALDPAQTYRIRVLVAGTELGYADVDLVNSGKELKNVDTGEFIALLDGSTLPIKFRIEQGAVQVIGAEGGTVHSGDGNVTIEVPPGAVTGTTGFTVQPATISPTELADAGLAPGTVYQFGPSGAVFPTPVTVTLRYDPAGLGGQPEDQLVLLTRIGDKWAQIPNATVNLAEHTVTAPVGHFSLIATGYGDPTSIAPRSLAIVLGQTDVGLTAYTAYGMRLRSWSSATPGIAAIDPVTGMLHAVSPGLARIRVSVYDPSYVMADASDEIYVAVVASAPAMDQYAWFTQREGWTNQHLYGIHGVSSTDFFIVGRGGTILRSNGTSVTPVPSSTTRTLLGVWVRNATDAYVVGLGAPGTGSSVQRFNGTNWVHIFVDPAVTVFGVHGNSRYAYVAAGDRGVMRFDAAANALLAPAHTFPAGTIIRAVAAEEDNDIVLAVGDIGGVGMIFRSLDNGATYDAGVVPPMDFGPPQSGPLTAVWRDPTRGHAAATSLDGRIVVSGNDGGFWGVNRQAAGRSFRAITSRPMGVGSNLPTPEVYLGGDNGQVWWNYRCRCPLDNYGFQPDQAFNQDINGMWTAPDGIAWGVGLSGFIFRQIAVESRAFTVKSAGQSFADVWASSDGRVVVASASFEGEVFTTTSFGTVWRGTPLNPTGFGFQGAYGAPGGGEVWVVGFNGMIARGTPTTTGYTFSMMNSGTTVELDDVWLAGLGSRPVYVVGRAGTVLKSRDRGLTWTSVSSPLFATKQIVQVYGIADNDVFVAAEDGSVYRTQDGGTSWSISRVAGGEFPTGLVIASATEAYMGVAHGGLGKIVRMSGGTWQAPQTIAGTRFMSGVWRSATGLVFVAGSNGTVVLSNNQGATWVPQVTGTTRDLFAISGAEGPLLGPRMVLFATGSAGTIIMGVKP